MGEIMDRDKRISYFKALLKKEPYGSMEIWYKGKTQKFPVFEIDLDYLIYNCHNGRINSLVKSDEKETGHELDPTDPKDVEKIEKFLWSSHVSNNKGTEKNIKEQGQLRYGIVTKDGVIIDGNRRSLILRRISQESPRYFRAVVLEEALKENTKEIMRLETTYQMGEDAKVDYNAIEKYLKCQDLKDVDFDENQIAKMMGEKPSKIKEYLSIMELMKDYLDKLGYSGIFTRLEKTEGTFVNLNSYLNRYKEGKSSIIQWKRKCGESDLNDLKLIYFDIIRGVYNKPTSDTGDPKDYRIIGQISKKESFFRNEDIWEKFRDQHFKDIDPISEKEKSIEEYREENPKLPLSQLFKRRDEVWAKEVDSHLKKNMGLGRDALDNKNKQNAPLELLESAKAKLDSINTEGKAFLEDSKVLAVVNEINRLTYEFKKIIDKGHKKGH